MNATGENELNVLYCIDENYAPMAGISMTSLYMNNRDIEKITVYLVLDHVSKINKDKFKKLAHESSREVVLIDAEAITEKIKSLNIPTWRGSNAANLRLFITEYINSNIKRLLYLDADTIILGSLMPLVELDMKDNCIAMVKSALATSSHYSIADEIKEYYFSGVMLIDVERWKQENWMEKLLHHIKYVRAMYPAPDEYLLNIVCANNILSLPQKYNFIQINRMFSDETYYSVMKNSTIEKKELIEARSNPVIIHTARMFGQFPWYSDSVHPDKEIFDSFFEVSLWKDCERPSAQKNIIFLIEHKLFEILPEKAFFRLFIKVQEFSMMRRNKQLQKIERENRAKSSPVC